MVLLDLFFSLFVVIWQGHENQRELDVPDRKVVAQQVLLNTASKVSKYGVISGPYFLTFGLNTGRYGVSLRIQFECVKIWTRKNSVFRHFSRSGNFEDERFYINLLTTENLRSLVEVNAFSTSMSKQ